MHIVGLLFNPNSSANKNNYESIFSQEKQGREREGDEEEKIPLNFSISHD